MEINSDKITLIISKNISNIFEESSIVSVKKVLNEMHNAGLLKKPIYNLPLVDTIGKKYYTSNKIHQKN